MRIREDMTGKRFGRLLVLGPDPEDKRSKHHWKCICDCGNAISVYSGNLRNGSTQSCGCLAQENRSTVLLKHGLRHTSIYRIWQGIKSRCFNPHNEAYPKYGGNGRTMCEGWKNDAGAFAAALGPRPSPGHSVDRIDNDGGYWCGQCPECAENHWPMNCRWATRAEQANNRDQTYCSGENGRSSKLTESDVLEIRSVCIPGDRELGFSALAKELGVDSSTIRAVYHGKSWKHLIAPPV